MQPARLIATISLLLLVVSGILAEDEESFEEIESSTTGTLRSTTVFSIDNLNEKSCNKTLKGCCDALYLGEDEDLMKCLALHQSKLPEEHTNDPTKLFKFVSCFVECLYKQKKYVAKGDNINMKMVRLDAQKVYENRPKERDYHINMFEHCRKEALTMYNLIKMNPAGQVVVRAGCKPYLMLVYLCQTDYHKKKFCPYFRWKGSQQMDNELKCEEAKNTCYEIDGIDL